MNPIPATPEKSGEYPRARIRRVLGEPRFHTASELAALAYASDGLLWSVEEAGWLRCWTADGRQLRQTLLSDLETLWMFNPDATILASASDDVTLWDAREGSQIAAIQQLSWVTALAFSPDKATLATGHDDGRVRLWNSESQALIVELRDHDSPISALAFSNDGKRLATAGEDRAIHIIDMASRNKIKSLTGHTDRVPALAWHPDGKLLASAGWDTTARLWDVASGEPVMLLNAHSDQVLTLAFSRDGALLACADSDNIIHVWDNPTSGKTLSILQGHTDEIRALAFSPDGLRLASAGNDQAVHVWDPRRGLLLAGQNAQTRHSISVADGRLASNCGGTALEVYDLATGKAVPPSRAVVPMIAARKPEPDNLAERKSGTVVPGGVALSPDARWLVAGGVDSYLHIWDMTKGEPPRQVRGSWGPVGGISFAPDGKLFASACADDGTCWVWSIAKREIYLLMPEAADGCSVEAVAFHPNNRWLACGGIDWLSTRGSDGAICLWDVVDRQRLFIFEGGVNSLSFHPNGRWLAGASLEDEQVTLWDVTDGEAPAVRLPGHQERVRAVAFSPNGRWLVSAGDDRTLRIWNGETFDFIGVWQFDAPIKALAFSADGATLFAANANTTCSELDWQGLVEDEKE
jgi:WD40 repeat protein